MITPRLHTTALARLWGKTSIAIYMLLLQPVIYMLLFKIVSATFFGPAIPLLGISPTDTPAYAQNDMYKVAQCSIFIQVKTRNNLTVHQRAG